MMPSSLVYILYTYNGSSPIKSHCGAFCVMSERGGYTLRIRYIDARSNRTAGHDIKRQKSLITNVLID